MDGSVILNLLLAALFGSTVGIERYIHGRPAGLRTYLLVCVAFASIAILSGKLVLVNGSFPLGGMRTDPGRLMAGGLTGIGFLGAGIIIRGGLTIHGLTTAAGIWGISVVGLAVGSGCYELAVTLYGITLSSLMGLRYVEPLLKKEAYKILEISIRKPGLSQEFMGDLFRRKHLRMVGWDVSEDRSAQVRVYQFTLSGKTEDSFHAAYQELSSLEAIESIRLTSHDLG
jgi:putative Mg2+ transporter-C (MgtC) family protein